MARAPKLPEFESPPLVEVAISLQFAPLQGFTPFKAAALWQPFRKQFPKEQVQPPLNPAFETFGATAFGVPTVNFEVLQAAPQLRYWFSNEQQTQLVQIQEDRFVHNWRKMKDGDVYVRYDTIRREFVENLAVVQKWAAEEFKTAITPNQCEVTYVNQIELPDGDTFQRVDEILTLYNSIKGDFEFEDTRIVSRFRFYAGEKGKGEPIGRIHVKAEPMRTPDGKEKLQLSITARAAPSEPTIDASLDMMDILHVNILSAFVAVTTPQMHELWRRTV